MSHSLRLVARLSLLLGVLSILLVMTGCPAASAGGGTNNPTAPAIFVSAQIFVNAADSTALHESVIVQSSSGGSAITTATVSVNGSSFPYNSSNSDYEGSVSIATGAAINLSVTVNGFQYTASATQFTSYPTVSAPTSGATWSQSIANSITWSGGPPTTGAEYVFGITNDATLQNWVYGNSTGGPNQVPMSTTSATVPAGTLTTTGSYNVLVGIIYGTVAGNGPGATGGIPITNAASSSYMAFGAGAVVPITVN